MNAKFLFAGIVASLTLGVAVATGVSAFAGKETKAAQAATGDANSDVYLNLGDYQCNWDSASARFFFICKDGYGNDQNWYEFTDKITPLGTSDSIYHLEIPVAYEKFCVVRRNPEHTTTWNYTDTYTSSAVSGKNVIKVFNSNNDYSYSSLDDAQYNIYSFSASATNGTALVSQKGGSENKTSGYLYAHMEFQVSGTPNSEYYFTEWTITGTTTALDSTSISNQTYAFKATSNITIEGNYASARSDAVAFAQGFNSAFEAICEGTKNNAVGIAAPSAISDEWTEQIALYANHSNNADFVSILKNATSSSSNEDLAAFALKYDYIISKYTGLANFAERTVISPFGSRTLKTISETSAATPAIVAVVGLTTLTAVGGFFLLKKKPF